MRKLIGSDPNQVPSNADLGSMAYQDSSAVTVGKIKADALSEGELPSLTPSLLFDFENSQMVDTETITFTRHGRAFAMGPDGYLVQYEQNEPRIDYHPLTGECLGLLVEEARTNLLEDSDRVGKNAGSWDGNGSRYFADWAANVIDPQGRKRSVVIADYDNTYTNHNMYQYWVQKTGDTVVANQIYAASMYVREATSPQIVMAVGTGADTTVMKFVFATEKVDFLGRNNYGTGIGNNSSLNYIEDGFVEKLQNGWYRIGFTYRADNTADSLDPAFQVWNGNSSGPLYTGDTTKYTHIWGPQVERCEADGSARARGYHTSYIETNPAGGATRPADMGYIADVINQKWFNPTRGTILAKYAFTYDKYVDGNYPVVTGLDNGTSNLRYHIRRFDSQNNSASPQGSVSLRTRSAYTTNGLNIDPGVGTSGDTETHKTLLCYDVSDGVGDTHYYRHSHDGEAYDYREDDNAGRTWKDPIDWNDVGGLTIYFRVGCDSSVPGASSPGTNAHIKKIAYYPQSVTRKESAELTRI